MIYLWQEERGKQYYRFQTDEREIANKMKRRNKFKLISWGVNYNHWIYLGIFSRPDIARKTLKVLSGNEVKFNIEEDLYKSVTNISATKKEVE